jgi:hypothetical protein
MDRRSRAQRANRKAAEKRREKAKIEKELLAMGPAWATVVYVSGEGYALGDLHEGKGGAEEIARQGTQKAMDDAAYISGAPYTVVFAAPVLLDKGYVRDKPYYANLRAATGGHAPLRAIALWESRDKAEAEAAATAELPEEEKYIFIGGPVQLSKKPAPPAAEAPAPKTKAERRAEKKAAKKAAKRRGQAPPGAKNEGGP